MRTMSALRYLDIVLVAITAPVAVLLGAPALGTLVGEVVEQRRLADSSLPADNQNLAASPTHTSEEALQRLLLAPPPKEPGGPALGRRTATMVTECGGVHTKPTGSSQCHGRATICPRASPDRPVGRLRREVWPTSSRPAASHDVSYCDPWPWAFGLLGRADWIRCS